MPKSPATSRLLTIPARVLDVYFYTYARYERRRLLLLLPDDDDMGEEGALLSSMMRAKSIARFLSSSSCCLASRTGSGAEALLGK